MKLSNYFKTNNMKRSFCVMLLFIGLGSVAFPQSGTNAGDKPAPTSIGMVIYSQDVETVWNALRLANFAVNSGDTVQIFLLGKGVVLDSLAKNNADIKKQSDIFLNAGGLILGCGTCLFSRNNLHPQVCTMSSMSDLYAIVRKSKILLTF
jgi:uncharacterized protein involved in oxidation of intracellular sulfur